MNILHLRASNFYGGPERQLHLHALEARGSEYDVTLASFQEDGRSPEFLELIARDGIDTHSFAVSSAYDIRAASSLRTYLRERSVDLLCTHEYRSSIVGWLAVQGTATRWMAFSRGFTTENLKVRIYQWIDRLLVHRADHIVAVSEAQKSKLQKLRIPSIRISVVPNAVDPSLRSRARPVDLRRRFGFAPKDFVCVAGGRFSREKGQEFLVDAAAQALRVASCLRVVLFGDGPERLRIQARIARLGIADHVICPGFERSMSGCMLGADLVVNPSLSEGMPNIVLEAMGLEVPVLATAVGGVPEIIVDGGTGRLVPPADVGALADRLVEAATHRDAGCAMAFRARQVAIERMGFASQFVLMRKAYVRGVAGRG